MDGVSIRTLAVQKNTNVSAQKNASGVQSGQDFTAFMQNTNTKTDAKANVNATKDTKKTDNIVQAKATNNVPGLPENVRSLEEMVMSGSIDKNCLDDAVIDSVTQGIRELLMDGLGISAEELDGLMQQLSLNDADLLDDDNIKAIVMLAYGMVDNVELVMNQEAYDTLMDITEKVHSVVETVCEENHITVEELKTAVEQTVPALEPETDIAVQDTENVMSDIVSEMEPVTAQEEVTLLEHVTETVGTAQEEVIGKEQDGTAKTTVEQTDTEETVVKAADNVSVQETADENENTKEEGYQPEEHTEQNLERQDSVPTKVQTNVETITTQTGVQTVYTTVSDAVELVKQIVEQIQVQVTPEHSSMEMQLNPENLGKVMLNVSSKHGVITAHMTVENEAVRAAVESQLIQLKENLNEQGLKVEAVEVSVETKGFERQEQNQSQGQQKAEEMLEKENADRRRNINLREALAQMDGSEELTEQEQLLSHIMRAHGNTVDFIA